MNAGVSQKRTLFEKDDVCKCTFLLTHLRHNFNRQLAKGYVHGRHCFYPGSDNGVTKMKRYMYQDLLFISL